MLLLGACGEAESPRPIGNPIEIQAPLGLPAVPFPDDNPPTRETIELGRKLFHETALSSDGTVSCATCHDPQLGFADGKTLAEGVAGKKGLRNSPTVLNAVYNETQFHDGRAASLEEQAEGPVTNPVEMASSIRGVERALKADPGYLALFEAAFGPGPVTFPKAAKSLAAFERTLISGNSPFDRFRYGDDEKALSPEARRGWEVFRDPERGNCTVCHHVGAHTAPFTDHLFHNTGAGLDAEGRFVDFGRHVVTGEDSDLGAFKTPTLRNVALTAPYMHDGSLPKLGDVVDFYALGGRANPGLDPDIKPLPLTAQDRSDLVAFLESLTGEPPPGR